MDDTLRYDTQSEIATIRPEGLRYVTCSDYDNDLKQRGSFLMWELPRCVYYK